MADRRTSLYELLPRLSRCLRVAPLGAVATGILACSAQPLEPWHTARLSAEFDAGMVEEVTTFEDYVALEERLFDEVRREVYTEVGTGPEFALVRYSAGSAADPATR